MMGETFKYAAPIAGALGFSVEDTAEAIETTFPDLVKCVILKLVNVMREKCFKRILAETNTNNKKNRDSRRKIENCHFQSRSL